MDVSSYATVAERNIIGSILIDTRALAVVREIVKPEDFYNEAHRAIYACMCDLEDAQAQINTATVFAKLANNPSFVDIGGVHFLAQCTSELPSAMHVEGYAETVRADSIRRKVASFGDKLKAIAAKPVDDIDSSIAILSDELLSLSTATAVTPWVDFKKSCDALYHDLESPSRGDIVPSGFIDLDKKLSGFRPGTLTIIAARPAMGKTAFGLNIMQHAAIEKNIPVAFFSLEMTSQELTARVLSCAGNINGNALRQQTMDKLEWDRLVEAIEKFSMAPIYTDETPGLDISILRERARRMHRQFEIRLIIVDYLQLLTSNSKRASSREQEIAAISRGLKGLSKELHIPVIALAQLSRNTESRVDKHPLLCDLRESGSIEQDADNVLFIHREDYYHPNDPPTNKAEIIIAKQRSGPTGIVELHWDGRYTRFSNLEREF